MHDYNDPTGADLVRAVEQQLRGERERREPLGRAWLAITAMVVMFGITIWMEWSGIHLALNQLFPTLSDGSSEVDTAGVLTLLSLFGILLGEVLLDNASAHWSEPVKSRVRLAGMISLVLFVLGMMLLVPFSTLQANDPGDGGGEPSIISYLAFSGMLAALFPMSLLANFTLFEIAKQALGKIERAKTLDKRIRNKSALLAQRETALADQRAIAGQQASLPTDEQIEDEYCAQASAAISEEAGRVKSLILLRETPGTDQEPLKATSDPFFNHVPLDRLRAHFEYLASFTPAAIRQRLN